MILTKNTFKPYTTALALFCALALPTVGNSQATELPTILQLIDDGEIKTPFGKAAITGLPFSFRAEYQGAIYAVTLNNISLSSKCVRYNGSVSLVAKYFSDEGGIYAPSPTQGMEASPLVVSLYPNPTSGPIKIKAETGIQAPLLVAIYDAQGREVEKRKLPAQTQHAITFDQLQSGIYTVRLILGQEQKTLRVVIE